MSLRPTGDRYGGRRITATSCAIAAIAAAMASIKTLMSVVVMVTSFCLARDARWTRKHRPTGQACRAQAAACAAQRDGAARRKRVALPGRRGWPKRPEPLSASRRGKRREPGLPRPDHATVRRILTKF